MICEKILGKMVVMMCAYVAAGGMNATAAGSETLKSQLDVAFTVERQSGSEDAYRILFVGDSITRHGFNKNTEKKLGWGHLAGMAASAEASDYAHRFADLVQQRCPGRHVEIYFHTSGGGGSAAERLSAIDDVKPIEPHLVVIQLGEHEKLATGEDEFRSNYAALLNEFVQQKPRPQILCTGVWSPGDGSKTNYTGWTARVEAIMKEECAKRNIPLASVEKYALDPSCSGWGSSRGVQWHPNDKGHLGYATALMECYKQINE
jgi:lysophospholipase L1-like esterase